MELSLENHELKAEQKLAMIIRHSPTGIAEIDNKGNIVHLNIKGEKLLQPVLAALNINSNNFYDVLEQMAPSLVQSIKTYPEPNGPVVINETHGFTCFSKGENTEIHFLFTIYKISACCISIHFDDITERRMKEKVMH